MNRFKLFALLICSIFCFWGTLGYASDCIKTVVLIRHGEDNLSAPHGQLDCQGLNRALALRPVLDLKYGRPAAIYTAAPSVNATSSSTDPTCFDYVRPFGTIEPTAVYFDMTVLTTYGVGSVGGPQSPQDYTVNGVGEIPASWILTLPQSPTPVGGNCGFGLSPGDIDLANAILKNQNYCGQTIFVTWEHRNIPIIVYGFYKLLGIDPTNQIPLWPWGECLPSYAAQGFCTVGTFSPDFNFDTLYVLTINQTTRNIAINLDREGLDGQSVICPI